MREIKYRKRPSAPKVLDRAAIAAQRTKEAIVAIKKKTDDVKNGTAEEYAADKMEEAARYAEYRVERSVIKRSSSKRRIKRDSEKRAAEKTEEAAKHAESRIEHSIIKRSSSKNRIKRGSKGVKNANTVAKNTLRARVATRAAKMRQRAAQNAHIAAKKAAASVKAVAKATWAVMVKLAKALKALAAALMAGGSVCVLIIVVILLIALLVASPFGIFLSGEAGTGGYSMKQTTAQLTDEYYDEIKAIERTVAHDRVEVKSSDGLAAINWADVLAVYAVKTTAGKDGVDVATMDEHKLDILRGVMWDMNDISFSTHVTTKQVEVVVVEDGEEVIELQTVTEKVLIIDLTHKSCEEAATFYAFTPSQNAQLAELQSDEYAHLWTNLIGAFRDANGEIIVTDADWIGTGFFSWPLPINGDFNSGFGYRSDPFDGSIKFHGGIDLGAAEGTPILAAAGGTVTIANATDPWGYGYGYYVRIDHGNGYATLYGHCSAVAVSPGQTVQQGQVIAYVGTTGNSTGNHLHFEVYEGGTRVDPLAFFTQ